MINEQLLQYIKSQREAGTSDEEIKENLSAAGWRDEDIAEGFEAVSGPDDTSPESHQEVRKKATEDRQQGQDQQQDKQQKNERDATQSQSEPAESGSDQYRESVDTDSQQAAAAGNVGGSRHAANEEPQELRTMEEDKKRFGDQKQQKSQDRPSQSSHRQEQKTQQQMQKKQTDSSVGQKPQHSQKSQQEQKSTKPKASAKDTQSTRKEQAQSSKDATDEYSPTQAKQEQPTKDQTQQSAKQQQKRSPKSRKQKSPAASQASRKPSSRKAAKRKQKQRKSQIQKARQQSSSTSISAIILSVLALVLVGGGAAYAYLNYFQGPTAKTSSQEVMQSLANAETFEYRIGVSRQAEGESTSKERVVVEGAVNLTAGGDSYYTIRRPSQPGDSAFSGVASEFTEFDNLDQRQKQTINQTLLQPKFFTVREFQTKEQLGATENASGFATNRFGVMANPTQLSNAYSTIYEAIYGESVSAPAWSTLQENLNSFNPQQGQMWVHPTTSVPYQITFIGTGADGSSMQVNMQFRDHGGDVASAPRTYESRPVVSGLAEAFNTATDDQGSDLTDEQSTSSDSTVAATTSNQATTTDSGSDDPGDSQQDELAQSQDYLRINNIQQLRVALQSYANENGGYPANLNELASSQSDILSGLPTDPQTGSPYAYAVNQAQTVYHLGATLNVLSNQEAPDDADYDSTTGSFTNGFDGSQATCGSESQFSGSTCYDLRGTVSTSAN